MTERLRITRIRLGSTQSGKPVAELYDSNTKLRFPSLFLFNLGELLTIGLDPNTLTEGEDHHCNFWAHFELSEKLNAKGNPYKDIISLEAINAPATTTSTDSSALLGELRAIKALLLELAASSEESRSILARIATLPPLPAGPVEVAKAARIKAINSAKDHAKPEFAPPAKPPAGINSPADTIATDPDPDYVDFAHAEVDPQATDPLATKPTLTSQEAREEFFKLMGEAIPAGKITSKDANALIAAANGDGWNAALEALQEKLNL